MVAKENERIDWVCVCVCASVHDWILVWPSAVPSNRPNKHNGEWAKCTTSVIVWHHTFSNSFVYYFFLALPLSLALAFVEHRVRCVDVCSICTRQYVRPVYICTYWPCIRRMVIFAVQVLKSCVHVNTSNTSNTFTNLSENLLMNVRRPPMYWLTWWTKTNTK